MCSVFTGHMHLYLQNINADIFYFYLKLDIK